MFTYISMQWVESLIGLSVESYSNHSDKKNREKIYCRRHEKVTHNRPNRFKHFLQIIDSFEELLAHGHAVHRRRWHD